jgi:hypothetical protein
VETNGPKHKKPSRISSKQMGGARRSDSVQLAEMGLMISVLLLKLGHGNQE